MLSSFKMYLIRSTLLIILGLISSLAHSETVIKVGGYEFPPFLHTNDTADNYGATIELIETLNRIQSDYIFEYFPTSSKRRYMDFSAGRYDMIMFENVEWGWQDQPVEQSKVFMAGEERYIAYRREGRGQDYFDDIASKRIVGILGFHYGFADFNADETYLSEHFNVLLSTDHLRNIQLILANRPEIAEVAVVSRSFLGEYLRENPEHRKQLLISDKFDQTYQHRVLIRKDSKISVEKMNELIDALEADGVLDKIRKRFNLNKIES